MLLSCKRTKPARRAVTAAGMSGRNRAFRGRGGVQAAGASILASLADLFVVPARHRVGLKGPCEEGYEARGAGSVEAAARARATVTCPR